MKEKKETSNKEIKDSDQAENNESKEIGNIPGKCPKCGSEDVEYDDDDDSDSQWEFPSQTVTLITYQHFICEVCKCKSTDVYINRYSHTEIDEETDSD